MYLWLVKLPTYNLIASNFIFRFPHKGRLTKGNKGLILIKFEFDPFSINQISGIFGHYSD